MLNNDRDTLRKKIWDIGYANPPNRASVDVSIECH